MKTYILILIAICSLPAAAQDDPMYPSSRKNHAALVEYGNFKVDNNDIIYQRIVDTVMNMELANRYLQSLGAVRDIQVFDDYITADFNDLTIDYRVIGRRWGTTPVIFNHYSLNGKIKIEFKDEKYRVTLNGLKLHALSNMAKNTGGSDDLCIMVLKKKRDQIRPGTANLDVLSIYDEYLTKYFTIKTQKDDW